MTELERLEQENTDLRSERSRLMQERETMLEQVKLAVSAAEALTGYIRRIGRKE